MRWPGTTRLPERLTERENTIARQVLKEIRARLGFLVDVGLDYLTLDRASGTLSGGEAQRIRLATQIGSGLMGVLYILDEPSIGLHQRDNDRLIATLDRLRDLGNTLLVVEHDEETIRSADWVIDIGPAAGEHGGRLIHSGPLDDCSRTGARSPAAYLRGDRAVPVPRATDGRNGQRRVRSSIRGARENNLKDIDVAFPLGKFVAVTGVQRLGQVEPRDPDPASRRWPSASGARASRPASTTGSRAIEHIDKVIDIDQSPIGRTPRSNPATYTGLLTPLRELFAAVPEARLRGYKPGRFSFNVKGGRCEACEGDGIVQIEMHFLPDVYVPCEVCKGKRYNRETLEIHYKGKNIADVLEMTVEEALTFFEAVPAITQQAPDPVRRRARLHPPRPAGDDPLRRRGAAGQAGHGAVASGRPARRSTSSTSRRRACTSTTSRGCSQVLVPPRRERQHRRRHRAQPRRHQDGRLGHRPRAGGRRQGRRARRGRHAGAGRADAEVEHRADTCGTRSACRSCDRPAVVTPAPSARPAPAAPDPQVAVSQSHLGQKRRWARRIERQDELPRCAGDRRRRRGAAPPRGPLLARPASISERRFGIRSSSNPRSTTVSHSRPFEAWTVASSTVAEVAKGRDPARAAS